MLMAMAYAKNTGSIYGSVGNFQTSIMKAPRSVQNKVLKFSSQYFDRFETLFPQNLILS